MLHHVLCQCHSSKLSLPVYRPRLCGSLDRGWVERLEQSKMFSELSLLLEDIVWRSLKPGQAKRSDGKLVDLITTLILCHLLEASLFSLSPVSGATNPWFFNCISRLSMSARLTLFFSRYSIVSRTTFLKKLVVSVLVDLSKEALLGHSFVEMAKRG